MQLSIKKLLLIGFLVFALLIAGLLVSIFRVSSTIIVGKSTTVITEPLRPDGTPDLAKHLFDKYSEGVTPENNAAVLLWRAAWPGELDTKDQIRFCDAIGLRPMPSAEESMEDFNSRGRFEEIEKWLRSKLIAPTEDTDVAEASSDEPNEGDVADAPDSEEAESDDAESEEREPDEDDEDGYGYEIDISDPDPTYANGLTYELFDADTLLGHIGSRPWTSDQVPMAAEWIEQNNDAIDLVVEASKRTHYFSPSPTYLNGEEELLIMQLLPGVHMSRQCARAVALRAMWHLGEGRIDDAWNDSMANLRLANLVGRGPTMIHNLVGNALFAIGTNTATAVLGSEELTVEQARRMLAELKQLPQSPTMVEAIDGTERLCFVDVTVSMARGRDLNLSDFGGGPDLSIPRGAADWNLVLENGNKWYDRIVAALSQDDRALRVAALAELDLEIQQMHSKIVSPGNIFKSVVSKTQRSKTISDIMLAMMLPAVNAASSSTDRLEITRDMLEVAAALAVFRIENGDYPDQLDQLTPELLDSIPKDIFSGNDLIYERRGKGYLLYSISHDEKDDRGTNGDDVIAGEWTKLGEERDDYDLGFDVIIREPRPRLVLPWELEDSAAN